MRLLLTPVAWLPFRWLQALGQPLSRHYYRKNPQVLGLINDNLARCFPEINETTRAQLVRSNFTSHVLGILETIKACFAPNWQLNQLASVEHLEYLQDALAQKRGIILLSAHFTGLELAGRLFAAIHPLTITYKPQKNPLVNQLLLRARRKRYPHLITHLESKKIIKALQRGDLVFYACDVNVEPKQAVFVPFFKQLAATTPAVHYYAKLTNALVLPGFFYRRMDGQGYDLVLHPALDHFPSNDPIADTTRINQIIETAIRHQPCEYIWGYHRFKTAPPSTVEKSPLDQETLSHVE